ncbi:hypothetical protein [Streptomyces atroolivaceus]|uniref:hypothetical protein n=1 Tax=Streptomyces atroolivaceus TaxID=66869 RepID=UPI00343547AA
MFQPHQLTVADREGGEQEPEVALFAGAMNRFANPFSHCTVGFEDPIEAVQAIQLANAAESGQPNSGQDSEKTSW